MTEQDLLELLANYKLKKPTLQESIKAEPERVMERIYISASYNPEYFSDDVIEILVSVFKLNPKRMFQILQKLSEIIPEKVREYMDIYLEYFTQFPKEAISDFYYLSANNPQLVNSELIECLLSNMHQDPFNCIKIFQQWLHKRPKLIDEVIVEAVLNNISSGANQAFYFLRDVSRKISYLTSLCTLALFECVIKEHHYYVKREMLQDIIIIANQSHVKTSLEEELKKPLEKGTKVAKALMALIFRQKFRVQQSILLKALDYAAKWATLWDFFIMILEISDEQHISTSLAEEFLENIYRLGYVLNTAQFRKLIIEKLELIDIPEKKFPKIFDFLNNPELISMYSKAKELASRFEVHLSLKPLDEYKTRIQKAEEEIRAINDIIKKDISQKNHNLILRGENLENRLESWRKGIINKNEKRELRKRIKKAISFEISKISLDFIKKVIDDAVGLIAKKIFGEKYEAIQISDDLYPALFLLEKIGGGRNYHYLRRLIKDRLEDKVHEWLWTEPLVKKWMERVKTSISTIKFEMWRAPFSKKYTYSPKNIAKEKKRRLNLDLNQTRDLLKKLKIKVPNNTNYEGLKDLLYKIPNDADPIIVQEIRENLERIRQILITSDSDFEGVIELMVETDPFQYLFMGEHGFASCLSMRGSYFWSAVSNAIDIDKVVIWAKESGVNIVGRRLIALTPQGVVSHRTYANRHGLSLDKFFRDFVKEYANYCGTKYVKHGTVGPLLSDRWYDDGHI